MRLRVIAVTAGLLGALCAGGWWFMLAREAAPATSDDPIDLAELRRVAAYLPGDLPVRVNHQQVALASLPRGAVFAGQSLWTPLPIVHGAYQVVYADGYLVIDSAFDESGLREMSPDGTFDSDGYAAVSRALAGARKIVVTHEHADHVGGVARAAESGRLAGRLELTREQLANTEQLALSHFPEWVAESLSPLVYDRFYALAPGVVLVKAPGHTPGTQMVYVQLADGRELLFLGDIAWHMDQIRELWYRPRLVTDVFLGEDRRAVLSELRALHDLAARESVVLIASHDLEQRGALIDSGVLGAQFEF